jgi:uncharacterized protein YoxC
MDRLQKPNKNAKREEETKSFTNCTARPGGSQTTVSVSVPRNCTTVDLQIGTNLSILCSKATFFTNYIIITCIVCILSLVVVARYQSLELIVMEQNIMVLKQQVEILAGKSDSLRQNVDILQDRVKSLTYKCNSTVENVTDMKSRSLYSSVEHSDHLPTSTVSLPYDASDILDSVVPDNIETSDILQEFKLENINDSSVSPLMDILHTADDSLSHEDVATDEGVRVGRAKRSNRRGNQKPSEGHRHLNNKRKNRGTLNFLAFQDA